LPTVAGQCTRLAAQAERERQPYLGYLEALLAAELEDRERRAIERRLKEAHLPRVKTLDEFDFTQAPSVSLSPPPAWLSWHRAATSNALNQSCCWVTAGPGRPIS
jgi:DNA replication protein DnaC